MAWSFDAVSSDNKRGTPSSTHSWSHTIGSGSDRLLIVEITIEDTAGTTITGVTYNSTAMTLVTSKAEGSNYASMWYLLDASLPTTGAYTVEATASDAVTEWESAAKSYADIKQQAAEATATNSVNTGTTVDTNITTITNNALLVECVCSSVGAQTFTPDDGQTERYDHSHTSATSAGGDENITTAGLISQGWTQSSGTASRIIHLLAAFEEASAGSSIPVLSYNHYRNNLD